MVFRVPTACCLPDPGPDHDRVLLYDEPEQYPDRAEGRHGQPREVYHGNEQRPEGAGYAGGIMSAAMDGMKVAEKIIEKYKVNYE